MSLPDPCEKCSPFEGLWCFRRGGTCRCDCARGQTLAAMDAARKERTILEVEPAISEETATMCVSMLSAIRFFPSEAGARIAIASELQSMCNSDIQALWLARRMVRLFSEWPGVPDLRAVFCSQHVPLDRYQPLTICQAYPEGIPSEIEEPKTQTLALPAGHTVSADARLDQSVRMVARALDMNRALREDTARKAAEIPPTNPNFKPITQADIAKAVDEVREQRAWKALGLDSGSDAGQTT